MDQESIKAKVAKIVDVRTLVINKGLSSGVKIGDKFRILSNRGRDIVDPDNGEKLGELKIEKVRVEVISVEEQFSITKTYEYDEVNTGGIGSGITRVAGLMSPPKYERRYKTLRTEDSGYEELSEEESFVKVGDIAELIVSELEE